MDQATDGERGQGRLSLFQVDGDRFVPSRFARSPWNANHQNGVAIAALLTHLAQQQPAPGPMLGAHLTIDILRPTPLAPISGRAEVVRRGRKMQVVESVLIADGEITARARLLRLRIAPSPDFPEPLEHPQPEDAPTRSWLDGRASVGPLVETRTLFGDIDQPGPGAIWARFHADIVPGTPVAGLAQTAMLADFGNGLSSPLGRGGWSYANVDISVHAVREPVDSWVLLSSRTLLQGTGVGLVDTVLADRRGAFGRAHQTLFIEPLSGAR